MLKTMTDGKIPEFCHVRNRNQTSQHSLSASLSEVLDNGLYKHDTSVPTVFQRTRNHEHTNFTHESSPEIDSFAAYIRTHDLSFDSATAYREREAAFADTEGHPALAYMLAHYRGPGLLRVEYENEAAGAWRRVRQRTRAVMKGFRGGRWRLWKAG